MNDANMEYIKQLECAVEELRTLLKQESVEPVAWMDRHGGLLHERDRISPKADLSKAWQPLYTAPPTTQHLSDEEIHEIAEDQRYQGGYFYESDDLVAFIREIEKRLAGKES